MAEQPLHVVTTLPKNPNTKLTLKNSIAVAENSVARKIFDLACSIYYHPSFASWFAKAYLSKEPSRLQVKAMEEILSDRAPEMWFVSPKMYNREHRRQNPEASWGWTPRRILPFTICLNSNLFWTMNEFGARTERQIAMTVAMGVVTFLHELTHYVISHTGDTSPLSAPGFSELQGPKLVVQYSTSVMKPYEREPDREGREAGSRLEKFLFGGKPGYTVINNSLHYPSEMVLTIPSRTIFFYGWEKLIDEPRVLFAQFPIESPPPSPSSVSSPCSYITCPDCDSSSGALVPSEPEIPSGVQVYHAPPDMEQVDPQAPRKETKKKRRH